MLKECLTCSTMNFQECRSHRIAKRPWEWGIRTPYKQWLLSPGPVKWTLMSVVHHSPTVLASLNLIKKSFNFLATIFKAIVDGQGNGAQPSAEGLIPAWVSCREQWCVLIFNHRLQLIFQYLKAIKFQREEKKVGFKTTPTFPNDEKSNHISFDTIPTMFTRLAISITVPTVQGSFSAVSASSLAIIASITRYSAPPWIPA